MKFSDIQAQEVAVRALQTSIKRSSIAHAYLFAGPKGCGKTTAAIAFASLLNCVDPSVDGNACGICLSCMRIESGDDADVQMISPDGNQTKMEQMQEMIRSLSYAPLSGKYRVYIIEQADTLNASSENCILKILEEPPSYAVLILLSNNPNSLLPTIRSRCQKIRFRRAGTSEVEKVLSAKFHLNEEELRVIAGCSQGLIGRALTLASEPNFLEERRLVYEILIDWWNGPPVISLRAADSLKRLCDPRKDDPDERTRVQRLTSALELILSWYNDLLNIKVSGNTDTCINVDNADVLLDQAEAYSMEELAKAVSSIMETRRYIVGNITPQLALENMLFDLRPQAAYAAPGR